MSIPKNKSKQPPRCEGWHRTGVFQMGGTGHWEQCSSKATQLLTFVQEGQKQTMPSCDRCAKVCVDHGIKILKSEKY